MAYLPPGFEPAAPTAPATSGGYRPPGFEPSPDTAASIAAPQAATTDYTPAGFEPDVQRSSSALERVLNFLATGNYASAGAAKALLAGGDPLQGVAEGVQHHTTYGDILGEHGVTNPWLRIPAGFALDVALDPTTYLGLGGLTKAGEAAHAATLGAKVASLSGDAARVAEAAPKLAEAGRLGTTLAEQGAAGQRAAVTFMGRGVLPAPVNQHILGAVDRLLSGVGSLPAAQELRRAVMVAPELKGIDREAHLARLAEVRAATSVAERHAVESLRPVATTITKLAQGHGIEPRAMARAVSSAVELAKPNLAGTDLRQFMNEADRNVYDKTIEQAMEKANRGRGSGNIVGGVGSGRPVAPIESLPTGEVVKGTRQVPTGSTLVDAGSVGVERGSLSPALVDWRGNVGPLPEEALSNLKPGLADRLRRIEDRATAKMVAPSIVNSTRTALAVFGTTAARDLEPHVKDAVAQINALNAASLKLQQDAGVGISHLDDETVNYLAHIVRQEAARQIAELGGGDIGQGLSRLITEATGSAKQRGLRGLTVAQINDMAEAGKLTLAGMKPIKGGLFEENPFVATILRAGGAAKSAESARMLTDWAREYGTKDLTHAFANGYKQVPSTLEALQGVHFPPDIAQALSAHFDKVVQTGHFLRAYDTVQRIWKTYTLGIFPSYHTRNEVGDLWNSVVLGGTNPRWFGDAAHVLSAGSALGDAMKLNPDRIFTLGGKRYTGRELSALAERMGVTSSGIMSEVADRIGTMRTMPRTFWEAAGHSVSHNAALDLANKVGSFRENTTRLGTFMDRLAKGMSPEQAALETKKFLFDYQELTAFERDVLRRFFPFYSWTRMNTPLQVEYLLRKPGALAGVEKLRNEASGPDHNLGLENGAPLPRFLESGLPLHTGAGPEGTENFARLSGYLPAADVELAMDPKAVVQRMAALLSPIIKSPIESGINLDMFASDLGSGDFKSLERFPGEQENMLGVPVNRRYVGEALGNLRPITELNRFNPGDVFGTAETPGWFGHGTVRDRVDADPVTRAANLFASRVYPIDAEDQMSWSQHDMSTKTRQLQRLYQRAVARGDEANAAILQRQLAAMMNADAGIP